MIRALASAPAAAPRRPAACSRRGRASRSLARAAAGLVCGAAADVGEMLVVSLLTAGAAAAAACALASLVVWIAKSLGSLVVARPARALGRRLASVHAIALTDELRADDVWRRRRAAPTSALANGLLRVVPGLGSYGRPATVLPRSRASPRSDRGCGTNTRGGAGT
jgi:hypothetical protein